MSEACFRRRHRHRAVAAAAGAASLLAAALAISVIVSTVGMAPAASATDAGPVTTVGRPGSGVTKVFAHYFPPYPISLDNKAPAADYYATQYLDPRGEGGVHESYGGLRRDRLRGRVPQSGDWRLADLETEVRQAAGAGIDGFTVDVLSYSGSNWDQTVRLEQAAERVKNDFVIVPNLDMTASAGKPNIATTASKLAQLFGSDAAYQLGDGRYVLSTFEAEARSPQWWGQLQSVMLQQYDIRLALISVLLNASNAITVTLGSRSTSYEAPSGVSAKLVPLRAGRLSAELSRGVNVVLVAKAHSPVSDRPKVQDLDYHAVGVSARAR